MAAMRSAKLSAILTKKGRCIIRQRPVPFPYASLFSPFAPHAAAAGQITLDRNSTSLGFFG